MKKHIYSLLLLLLLLTYSSCHDNTDPAPPQSMFFPTTDNTWETTSMSSLGWNEAAFGELKTFLADKHTRSFMMLVNGRIVAEEYFNGHTASTTWPWNSAGKTLVASAVGIAQQNGLLNINSKASQYLGTGWTSETEAKENLITVKHLLTMTSGINDEKELIIKSNLTYLADAGTRWSYHNVFQKLMDVVAAASNQEFEPYFNTVLKNKLGMEGFWNYGTIYKIYNSNTRSMARFGILALNKGKWNGEQILNEAYFNQCISSSQTINPSYGYLWWLNGKTSYMVPGEQTVFEGPLVPDAPADMYAAMGAEDQRIYVVPSANLVVIRMGDASDPQNPSFAVSGFDNALWQKINAVIKR